MSAAGSRLAARALLPLLALCAIGCLRVRPADGAARPGLARLRLVPAARWAEPAAAEPAALFAPTPADGAWGVPVHADLAWETALPAGARAVYDVTLGPAPGPPAAEACAASPAPLCDPEGDLLPGAHYAWRVTVVDEEGRRETGPVWRFHTRPAPGAPLFADDFSADRGWIDESDGALIRDPDAGKLNLEVTAQHPWRAYVPIVADAGDARLSFRVNLVAAGGNRDFYVGLAEALDGAQGDPSAPTGFFISLHADTVAKTPALALPVIRYADQEPQAVKAPPGCASFACFDPDTYLDLGGRDAWRRVELTLRDDAWEIRVFDDAGAGAGALLDSQAGELAGRHDGYRYLLLYSPGNGLWEWLHAQLDDVTLSRANTP